MQDQMRFGRSVAVLSLLLTAASIDAAAAVGSRRELKEDPIQGQIVGGRDVPPYQRKRYPYFTSLRHATTGWHNCGATLIHPHVLLTAAHCMWNETAPTWDWSNDIGAIFYKARVGAWERDPVPATPAAGGYDERMVIRVALHGTYAAGRAGAYHDIALLLLDKPVTRAKVPLGRGLLPVNTTVTAIGFGRTNWDEPNFVPPQAYAARMQQLQMLVEPDQGGFLVAGVPPSEKAGTFQGDSGGPLLVPGKTVAEDRQHGIMSRGPVLRGPGKFTKVASHLAWIQRGIQVLGNPGLVQPGEPYMLKQLAFCGDLPNNRYCSYCNPLTADRLTCVAQGQACYEPFKGTTYLVKKCGSYRRGPLAPSSTSGCPLSIAYSNDAAKAVNGTGLYGEQVFTLNEDLGSQRPTDTHPRCAKQDKYVLKTCPGTLSNTVQCIPGTNSTSHKRRAGKFECCACRRTRHGLNLSRVYESVQTNSYYGYEPNCNAASRSLPGDVIVAYTGARMMGNIRRGCLGEAYAEVLLPDLSGDVFTGVEYKPFWMRASDLVFCDQGRSCGNRAELGANCLAAECCTVVAQGGNPDAACLYPPDSQAYGICTIQQPVVEVPCDETQTFSGYEGTYNFKVDIGSKGPNFTFAYSAYEMPDKFTVATPTGRVLFSALAGSGPCSCADCTAAGTPQPNGAVTLVRPAGITSVLITVNGYCTTTEWEFTASCAK